jgi:hypothetical protein
MTDLEVKYSINQGLETSVLERAKRIAKFLIPTCDVSSLTFKDLDFYERGNEFLTVYHVFSIPHQRVYGIVVHTLLDAKQETVAEMLADVYSCIDKGTSNPDYTQKIPEELWVQVQPNLIIRAPTTV